MLQLEKEPPLALSPNQVHLWHCTPSTIESTTLVKQYHKLLNETEKQRYERFHFEKDRHRHLATRALVRTTLSKYIPEIAPKDWQFQHNAFGKPSITPHNPIQFNISHSQDMIIIAITLGQEIGVDIENIIDRNNIEGLTEHCFNTEEQAYIFEDNGAHLRSRFFQMWTLKESYIKAYGKGLSIALKDLHFKVYDGEISLSISGKHQDTPLNWDFHSALLREDYQLAITVAHTDTSVPLDIKVIESTFHRKSS